NADLEIIDTHTHIATSRRHGEEYGRHYLIRWLQRPPRPSDYPFNAVTPDPTVYGTVSDHQEMMRRAGIAHVNILMFTWGGLYYKDGSWPLPNAPARRAAADRELKARIVERIRENNEWAINTVKEYKTFSFFLGIDPVVMDEKTLVGEIADKAARGALGAK